MTTVAHTYGCWEHVTVRPNHVAVHARLLGIPARQDKIWHGQDLHTGLVMNALTFFDGGTYLLTIFILNLLCTLLQQLGASGATVRTSCAIACRMRGYTGQFPHAI